MVFSTALKEGARGRGARRAGRAVWKALITAFDRFITENSRRRRFAVRRCERRAS
jgi:hypothetical protein